MTEYERGYAEGYKDGLHRFMPEAPSVPIPPIDAAIAEERAEPEPMPFLPANTGQEAVERRMVDLMGAYPKRAERAKPEPGDVVLYRGSPKSPWRLWMFEVGGYGIAEYVVLMRAADVRRKIEEAR